MPLLRLVRKTQPITPQTPDGALVTRAQAGDAGAFQALFERHVVAVRRFLMDLVRDRHAADDATQEAFARAHAQLEKLTEGDRFKPWMLGIARNVAFEVRRVRVHASLDDEEDEAVPDAVIPAPDPEAVLLDQELERHFIEALGRLSARRRAALLLRLDHGLSYEDIARTCGWSLATVKNEIHRARLALRVAMVPHLGGGRP
jgi:RNA polymerase sigma-70 factor (ECF subfamily)